MILSAFLLLASAAAAADGVPAPRWPLDLPERYLTSNFMEYRGGRYHAGLDLKTRSREGFAARAVEDGWIMRVRATPTAYGRAVYLRGASGRTYVYAHLSRFNDAIRARVAAARHRSGTYTVRLSFGPDDLPVRRGDALGLTGQSGTSGPHLHFEVRDAENRPLDPQTAGFAVNDTIPPRWESLRAIPATPDARIGGGNGAWRAQTAGGGILPAELPELPISGPVAFSAAVSEASDVMGHRLEPWSITVRLDGQVVYDCRNEAFDFADNGMQLLEWLRLPGIRERWLHRRRGVALPGREGDLWFRGTGGTGLTPGRHVLDMCATDRAGNSSTLRLPLLVVDSGAPVAPAMAGQVWKADFVGVELWNDNKNCGIALTPFFYNLLEDSCRVAVTHLSPADGDPVLADVPLAQVARALSPVQRARAQEQGLQLMGGATEYAAADWPVAAAPAVALEGPLAGWTGDSPAAAGLAAYRWADGAWRRSGDLLREPDAAGRWRLALEEPGLLAVFADVRPPVISPPGERVVVSPGPVSVVTGVTAPRWSIFALGVDDAGAGVDYSSLVVTVDGESLIVEPDPPRDRVLVELPATTPSGTYRLRLEVADAAGNRAVREMTVVCRAADNADAEQRP